MKKILIIEDEPQIRNNIKEILELSDFETLVAENGLQGLQLAQEKHPDLILCDLMMPELDGYGVLTQLRQNMTTAIIPLIFLTAKSDRSDVRRGMEMGADDYLTKPFQPDELLQAIATRFDKQSLFDQQTQEKLNILSSCITHSLPHEINTPLNHIIGLSKLLIEEHGILSDEENLEMLESIHRSGLRLYRLTLNFLVYADLELLASNPEKIANFRNHEVKNFVKSAIENVAIKSANNANRLADLKMEIADAMINVSSVKIGKIVEEIIDNAFKFSQPNTLVKIIGYSSNHAYHLYIIDHGRGMTKEQISGVRAYVQFERKMYEQQGSGLGLSIAKRLIELHGGEFSIESIPGKQTIVRMLFPQ
ncbi:response regulator [Anabaena cylindrica FACHB-243]|uniref:histidine kinase n=1 Tax=Anabaena cylindrica (strain ATCC 27899 / PCC 7122) TaxID=272123 RepID=K9Z9J6_ANACC|nr:MULTISPECIES: response regulator [Anabaena]AFZ55841.1 response regulator receiver sensor signal transduction histidine kinase [Anabaena cylindrica PCC 7122]MBD2421263.1 response regulator [Anabaena cylindrica FACHB-243]MBY5284122.1 response regulator [Anabaena sp. CCAP 1446/1C]MBY5308094.1 response regulator [Anabaena sp. CCAP 1446/1C]MCM2406594.1 response regulator [Anabaena sp. CCAP 1446/1C]